jgi:hypothetical protein
VAAGAPARPFGIADAPPEIIAEPPSAASPTNANLSFTLSSLTQKKQNVSDGKKLPENVAA